MQKNKDWLEFRLDGVRQDRISGNVSWQQQSYPVSGAGPHTLQWRYVKDASKSGGSDCGWVDYVQWSGSYPGGAWGTIAYTYDPAGRRIEKAVEGQTTTKYVYDGVHCIAEYDGSDTLLRKYVHGPGVDAPVCMIEVADANATYYYHFDGLGSCIALTDADANTVQLYEYSVYGRVAASDPNHTNRFLFTGRRFDADTGLYYYRARYYNPYIGRFLQTDPVGYANGMNWYAYCGNRPSALRDPYGLSDSPAADDSAAQAFPHFPPVLPPNWKPDWKWTPTPGEPRPGYWKDPSGGTWSPHPAPPEDPVHNPHWDWVDPKTGKNKRVAIDEDLPPLKPKPTTVLQTIGVIAGTVAHRVTESVADAATAVVENPATPYVVAGGLIAGDVLLGGPTGEGIAPALVILGR